MPRAGTTAPLATRAGPHSKAVRPSHLRPARIQCGSVAETSMPAWDPGDALGLWKATRRDRRPPFLCGGKHLFTNGRRGVWDREHVTSCPLDRMLRGRLSPPSLRCLLAVVATAVAATPVAGQSLRGSARSLDRQNDVARQHEFTYIDTKERVEYFAEQGWLVRIRPTSDFELHAVSFPYARPEVQLFIERLARQYRVACGERMVVTSLTRPKTRQPRNASDRSVHPTGMAIDLRYSRDRNCRRWLEGVLLDLEGAGILEATLERRPVHYHVALYPRQYAGYVTALTSRQRGDELPYTVRTGDSLWTIARSHGVSVNDLKDVNGLDDARIYPGQVLTVPQGS